MRRLVTAFALAVLPLAGCGSDNTGPAVDPVGTYNLVTIDGAALPFRFTTSETDTTTVLSGVIQISADGTYEDLTSLRISQGGDARDEVEEITGTWFVSGDVVFFSLPQGSYSAQVQGDLLLQTVGPFSLVYRRED